MRKPVKRDNDDTNPEHPIEVIYAPPNCQYYAVHSNLRIISQNQRKLYDKLDSIYELLDYAP